MPKRDDDNQAKSCLSASNDVSGVSRVYSRISSVEILALRRSDGPVELGSGDNVYVPSEYYCRFFKERRMQTSDSKICVHYLARLDSPSASGAIITSFPNPV
jgi:hypothetical protein